MDAGDANVEDPFCAGTHRPRGDNGFLCHGQIGGAGTDDENQSAPAGLVIWLLIGAFGSLIGYWSNDDGSGYFVMIGLGESRQHRCRCIGLDARRQYDRFGCGETFGDRYNLPWRLTLAEDRLRISRSDGPVVIDVSKTQIFKWQGSQLCQRIVWRQVTGRNGLEQVGESIRIHHIRFV